MNVLMAARPMFGAGRMMRDGLFFGGIGPFGFVFQLLVAAVVIGAIVWIVTRKPKQGIATVSAPQAADTALTIARERLARGEIGPEQYVAILDALSARAGAQAQPASSPSATE